MQFFWVITSANVGIILIILSLLYLKMNWKKVEQKYQS